MSMDQRAIRSLASAVIVRAIKDFNYSGWNEHFCQRQAAEFLMGKTQISRFWFSALDMRPLTCIEVIRTLSVKEPTNET